MPSSSSPAQGTSASQATSPSPIFPFARYESIVGVQTSLLAFSALLLPTTGSFTSILSHAPLYPPVGLNATQDTPPSRDILGRIAEHPTRSVAWVCLGALVVQGWWATWLRKWAEEAQAKPAPPECGADKAKRKMEGRVAAKADVQLSLGFAAAASVCFHAFLVLFGAPINTHLPQTYALSLLLALLSLLSAIHTIGLPTFGSETPALVVRMTWVRLFAELSPRTPVERALVYPAIGTLVGCWVGAIPIGLDWERPWQAWPLTTTLGAVGGYIAGSLAALSVRATLELARAGRAPDSGSGSDRTAPKADAKKAKSA